jgi:hypothetical protein
MGGRELRRQCYGYFLFFVCFFHLLAA